MVPFLRYGTGSRYPDSRRLRGSVAIQPRRLHSRIARRATGLARRRPRRRLQHIDLVWEIPDGHFAEAVEGLEQILASARPLVRLRYAPEFQRSDRRRLVFASFTDLPLFWRVDLDLLARSLQRDYHYDSDNPNARGEAFSQTNSALMNAVYAIKSLLRGDAATAAAAVSRGFQKIALPVPAGDTHARLLQLVDHIWDADDSMAELAAEVNELHRHCFPTGSA